MQLKSRLSPLMKAKRNENSSNRMRETIKEVSTASSVSPLTLLFPGKYRRVAIWIGILLCSAVIVFFSTLNKQPSSPSSMSSLSSITASMSQASSATVTRRPSLMRIPPVLKAEVISTHPHDIYSFTQGLAFHEGELYESTGLYGHGSLRHLDAANCSVKTVEPLPEEVFGEGLTVVNQKIYVLTWREHIVIQYDLDLKRERTIPLPTEGWGITHIPSRDSNNYTIVVSDGSSTLFFYNDIFEEKHKLQVKEKQSTTKDIPVSKLNELEYIDGYIWANIWYDNRIAVIDPNTGYVVTYLDLKELQNESGKERARQGAVVNGIAFDPISRRLLVTGKLWSKIYEIRLPEIE